jgi:hypothetical protein
MQQEPIRKKNSVKAFIVCLVLVTTGGCSAKERHMSALTNTRTTGNQIEHIVALQEMIKKDPKPNSSCPEYPAGYGGFVVSCRSGR